jgi:putative phosphoesterase
VLVAIVSDTHLPRGARRLPDACLAHLRSADLVLHAGDFTTAAVLDELEALGPPVHAVHGNVDEPALRARLLGELTVEVEDVRIAMTHDAGPATGRLERLRARFPGARAVVFGHSHIPLHLDSADGEFAIFNPGSPTDRRRQPRHTMGLAWVAGDQISFEIVALD